MSQTPAADPEAPSDGFLARHSRAYLKRVQDRPFVAAWQGVASATFIITLCGGLLVRVTDPDVFANLWLGMWWAVQTVTTVGYGDVLPESLAGRLIATLMMMIGIAFLTVTTAAIGSLFSESTRRRIARNREDPVHVEVQRLHERLDELVSELRILRHGAAASPSAGADAAEG
jgi:voltage-gated potassium channel